MKKILALLLISVMCLGLLVGCGGSETSSDAGTASTESTPSAETPSGNTNDSTPSGGDTATTAFPALDPITRGAKQVDCVWSTYDGSSSHSFAATSDYFNYTGRWQKINDAMKGHWLRAYFTFKFKGSSFKIVASGKYDVYYGDNLSTAYTEDGNGSRTYTTNPNETYDVKIVSNSGVDVMTFYSLETTGNLCRAESKNWYFLFIGDSLTEPSSSWSKLIPDAVDADYAVLAKGGLALLDGNGGYAVPADAPTGGRVGVESQFFNYERVDEKANDEGKYTPYDFSTDRAPDMIFMNLGTNDIFSAGKDTTKFTTRYTEFIQFLEKLYPNAKIYVALPTADNEDGSRLNAIEAAGKAAEAACENVTFINSRGWSVELSADGVHPSAGGYESFANYVMEAVGLK